MVLQALNHETMELQACAPWLSSCSFLQALYLSRKAYDRPLCLAGTWLAKQPKYKQQPGQQQQ